MYTEYQIRAALIKVIKQALDEMDVSGYQVVQRHQQTITHEYDCVIVDKINLRQNGFQAHRIVKGKDSEGKDIVVKRWEWIETWTWQISVAHRRRVEDTIDTLTGEDVAQRLRVWLDSAEGAWQMRTRKDVPFAPFQTFDLRLRSYKSDSDINQVEATFDFKMNVLQVRDMKPIMIDGFDWEVHGI